MSCTNGSQWWIVLAGRPGAGKGTQAKALAAQFGLSHVSTGELLRAAVVRGSGVGDEIASLHESGRLVPDDTMLSLLEQALNAIAPSESVLLDGFPRTVDQASALRARHPIDLVIELEVPARRVIERLGARKRHDDRAAAVAARLNVYERETRPMLRQFDALGVLAAIDGDRPPELVSADVAGVLRDLTHGARLASSPRSGAIAR